MNWRHPLPEQELTYAALLEWAEGELWFAGVEQAKNDARLLLFATFGISMTDYLLRAREPIAEDEKLLSLFLDRLAHRCRRVPLQHILGTAPFMGLDFRVNEDVLIPRADTEVLAERGIAILREIGRPEDLRVLDLCTGSGCLGIALERRVPGITCVATDISMRALEVARENAAALRARVTYLQGDLFMALEQSGAGRQEPFDLIVSNPPYIPSGIIETLSPEVRDHDPRLALDGGRDGLDIYRRITQQAPRYLRPGGYLCMEIGFDQADAVRELLMRAGFTRIRILQDLSHLDRVAEGVWACDQIEKMSDEDRE